MPSVPKMAKHAIKILQQMILKAAFPTSVFDYFVDIDWKYYIENNFENSC